MSSPAAPPIEEDDPIVHTYSVFIKPPLPQQRRLLVLQHPNNQSDHPETLRPPPITDIRLKPGSGMLEADVPLDYNTAYDRHKGIVWGSAVQKSAANKTSLGLPGGFGVGGAPARTRGRGAAAGDDVEGGDWNEALRSDRVLRKQTLGGLSTDSKDARYLVAVFQGSKSFLHHLTPFIQLS
jgi:DNA-directed RNA polymerase-3 subunit RPC5